MTAMTGEAATAASTSAFNKGNGTATAASAVEETLKVRAEVSARARADSGGCGKGGGFDTKRSDALPIDQHFLSKNKVLPKC